MAGVNFFFSRYRTRLQLTWSINAISSFLVLFLVLFISVFFQRSTELPILNFGSIHGQVFAIQFDGSIISLSIGIGAILLTASFLTPLSSRISQEASIIFALAGFAFLAVFSANPITLITAWVLIDLFQFSYQLIRHKEDRLQQNLSVNLVFRSMGIFLYILSSASATSTQTENTFILTSQFQPWLIIGAVLLRLRLIPPFDTGDRQEISLPLVGSYSHLIAGTTAFIPLIKTIGVFPTTGFENLIFPLLIIGSVFAGFSWIVSDNKPQNSQLFWLMVIATLAVTSSILNEKQAVVSWSQVYVFGGCILLYYYHSPKSTIPLLVMLTFLFTGLPMTPTWSGFLVFSGSGSLLRFLILVPYFLLIAGTVTFWKKSNQDSMPFESWQKIFYYAVHICVVVLFMIVGIYQVIFLNFKGPFWPGLMFSTACVLAILGFRNYRFGIPPTISRLIQNLFSFRWLRTPIEYIYFQNRKLFSLISTVLEGETGLLWSLLTMLILLSLLFSLGR